jgi:hypothetical protein
MTPSWARTEPLSWFLIKVFSVTGSVYAILIIVLGGFPASSILRRALFVAAGTTLVAGLMHYAYAYRKGMHRVPLPRQRATTFTDEPMSSATEQARAVLHDMAMHDIVMIEGEHPVLRARAPLSARSWGERIQLQFRPSSEGGVAIEIESKPRLATQVVDWAKGFENVQRLVTALGPISDSTTLPPTGGP